MKRFAYILSLLFVFILPACVIGHVIWDHIELPHLLTFLASITVLGSLWDLWATRHGKRDRLWIWQFHDRNTLGIKFFDIPIEEYLFYPSSALYVIFMWEGMKLGYNTGNIEYLVLLSTLAIWTLLAVILSFSFARK